MKIHNFEYTQPKFFEEFTGLLVGDYISEGSKRLVHAFRDLPYVVKICENEPSQNWREWLTWVDSKGTPIREWLAPCLRISASGRVLIQALTVPPHNFPLPGKVPAALSDLKVENFGLYEGRLVCHDYGSTEVTTVGMNSKKMKDARWWDGVNAQYLDNRESVTF